MDDHLVESLRQRLGDLERKVQTYRHDLAVDFQRHCQDVLRDVPPVVAHSVRRSLLEALPADYPLLAQAVRLDRLELDHADSRSVAPPGSGQRHLLSSSPPPTSALPAGSAEAAAAALDPPDSPREREREKELQGLFTPSYLPLLESSPQPPRAQPVAAAPSSSTTSTSPAASPATNPLVTAPPPQSPPDDDAMLLPDRGITAVSQGGLMDSQVVAEAQAFLPATPQSPTPSRPGHVRRSTDDTNSSVLSDRSEVKTPRSALRRSSSSSKPPQSPRRVRFEFMGAEVLPTASPQPTDYMAQRSSSPDDAADAISSDSILGVGDEQEFVPPRKISSSEALRALSRAPLDEGTIWTVVNANPDEILVEQEDLPPNSNSHLSPIRQGLDTLPAAPDPPSSTPIPMPIRSSPRLGSLSEEPEEEEEAEKQEARESDDSSDEEFLSMGKSKQPNNRKTSPSISPPKEPTKTTSSPPSTPTLKSALKSKVAEARQVSFDDHDSDEDDMFHFETGTSSGTSKPRPKHLVLKEEEEVDEVEDESVPSTKNPETNQALYATSPAVPISRPSAMSGPTTPTSARFQAGSLGSYKGRPVIMPVVRDPEIHAQAASLGQFNTFVGGLDGSSGMDEGDLNSFRASFADSSFTGAPRSFTERFMMEEAQARNNNNNNNHHDAQP